MASELDAITKRFQVQNNPFTPDSIKRKMAGGPVYDKPEDNVLDTRNWLQKTGDSVLQRTLGTPDLVMGFGNLALGNREGAEKRLMDWQANEELARAKGPEAQDIGDIEDVGSAASVFGYQVAKMVPDLIMGGVAGGLAKGTVKSVAADAIKGRLARKILESKASQIAEKKAADAAVRDLRKTAVYKELGNRAAERAAKKDVREAASDQYVKEVTEGATVFAKQSPLVKNVGNVGFAAGATVGSLPGQLQEQGQYALDNVDKLSQEDTMKLLAGSTVAASTDFLPMMAFMNRFSKTGVKQAMAADGFAKRMLKASAGGFGAEGGQEAAQAFITRGSQHWVDENVDMFSDEALQDYAMNFVAGGFIGGGLGASGEIGSTVTKKAADAFINGIQKFDAQRAQRQKIDPNKPTDSAANAAAAAVASGRTLNPMAAQAADSSASGNVDFRQMMANNTALFEDTEKAIAEYQNGGPPLFNIDNSMRNVSKDPFVQILAGTVLSGISPTVKNSGGITVVNPELKQYMPGVQALAKAWRNGMLTEKEGGFLTDADMEAITDLLEMAPDQTVVNRLVGIAATRPNISRQAAAAIDARLETARQEAADRSGEMGITLREDNSADIVLPDDADNQQALVESSDTDYNPGRTFITPKQKQNENSAQQTAEGVAAVFRDKNPPSPERVFLSEDMQEAVAAAVQNSKNSKAAQTALGKFAALAEAAAMASPEKKADAEAALNKFAKSKPLRDLYKQVKAEAVGAADQIAAKDFSGIKNMMFDRNEKEPKAYDARVAGKTGSKYVPNKTNTSALDLGMLFAYADTLIDHTADANKPSDKMARALAAVIAMPELNLDLSKIPWGEEISFKNGKVVTVPKRSDVAKEQSKVKNMTDAQKKAYWADFMSRLQPTAGFNDMLEREDVEAGADQFGERVAGITADTISPDGVLSLEQPMGTGPLVEDGKKANLNVSKDALELRTKIRVDAPFEVYANEFNALGFPEATAIERAGAKINFYKGIANEANRIGTMSEGEFAELAPTIFAGMQGKVVDGKRVSALPAQYGKAAYGWFIMPDKMWTQDDARAMAADLLRAELLFNRPEMDDRTANIEMQKISDMSDAQLDAVFERALVGDFDPRMRVFEKGNVSFNNEYPDGKTDEDLEAGDENPNATVSDAGRARRKKANKKPDTRRMNRDDFLDMVWNKLTVPVSSEKRGELLAGRVYNNDVYAEPVYDELVNVPASRNLQAAGAGPGGQILKKTDKSNAPQPSTAIAAAMSKAAFIRARKALQTARENNGARTTIPVNPKALAAELGPLAGQPVSVLSSPTEIIDALNATGFSEAGRIAKALEKALYTIPAGKQKALRKELDAFKAKQKNAPRGEQLQESEYYNEQDKIIARYYSNRNALYQRVFNSYKDEIEYAISRPEQNNLPDNVSANNRPNGDSRAAARARLVQMQEARNNRLRDLYSDALGVDGLQFKEPPKKASVPSKAQAPVKTLKRGPSKETAAAMDKAYEIDQRRKKGIKESTGEKLITDAMPIDARFSNKKWAFLSNFARRPFAFGNMPKPDKKGKPVPAKFVSVEHAYQTLKSGVFDDVAFEKGKTYAKYPGRFVADKDNTLPLLRELMLESFKQNPDVARKLVATGDAKFVHSVTDKFWALNFPKLLTDVRAELAAEAEAAATPAAKPTSKKVGFTLTPRGQYTSKDQLKASKATAYIGRGSAASSTNAYAADAKAQGIPVNSGEYTSDDIVFVSAEGARGSRVPVDAAEVLKAVAAGATIITDSAATGRNRPFNVGERETAQILTKAGYTENNGVWTPKVAAKPVAKTAAKPAKATTVAKLEALKGKLQSDHAEAALLHFIKGGIDAENGQFIAFSDSAIKEGLSIATKIAEGYANYPINGTWNEQFEWRRNSGVPYPGDLAELANALYRAGEAKTRYGEQKLLTAAEAAGKEFTLGIIPDWTARRTVKDNVVSMEDLCLHTSSATVWKLQASGYKATEAGAMVTVPGSKEKRKMGHNVALVVIDGEQFVVDQPQSELFDPTGKANDVRILNRTFTPRFIPKSEWAAAYNTPGVKFGHAGNRPPEALPLDSVTIQGEPTVAEAKAAPETKVEKAAPISAGAKSEPVATISAVKPANRSAPVKLREPTKGEIAAYYRAHPKVKDADPAAVVAWIDGPSAVAPLDPKKYSVDPSPQQRPFNPPMELRKAYIVKNPGAPITPAAIWAWHDANTPKNDSSVGSLDIPRMPGTPAQQKTAVRNLLVRTFGEKTVRALESAGFVSFKTAEEARASDYPSLNNTVQGYAYNGRVTFIVDRVPNDRSKVSAIMIHEAVHAWLPNMLGVQEFTRLANMHLKKAIELMGNNPGTSALSANEIANHPVWQLYGLQRMRGAMYTKNDDGSFTINEDKDQGADEALAYQVQYDADKFNEFPWFKKIITRVANAIKMMLWKHRMKAPAEFRGALDAMYNDPQFLQHLAAQSIHEAARQAARGNKSAADVVSAAFVTGETLARYTAHDINAALADEALVASGGKGGMNDAAAVNNQKTGSTSAGTAPTVPGGSTGSAAAAKLAEEAQKPGSKTKYPLTMWQRDDFTAFVNKRLTPEQRNALYNLAHGTFAEVWKDSKSPSMQKAWSLMNSTGRERMDATLYYLLQAHSKGELQLDAKTQKALDYITLGKRHVGAITDVDLGMKILSDMKDGSLLNSVRKQMPYQPERQLMQVNTKLAKAGRWVAAATERARKLFANFITNDYDRAESSGIPSYIELVDLIMPRAGNRMQVDPKTGMANHGVVPALAHENARWLNRLSEAAKGLDQDGQAKVLRELYYNLPDPRAKAKLSPAEVKAFHAIRKVYADMYDYAAKDGVFNGKNRRANYTPVLFDIGGNVEQHKAVLKRLFDQRGGKGLTDYKYEAMLDDIYVKLNPADKGKTQVHFTSLNAREREAFVSRLVENAFFDPSDLLLDNQMGARFKFDGPRVFQAVFDEAKASKDFTDLDALVGTLDPSLEQHGVRYVEPLVAKTVENRLLPEKKFVKLYEAMRTEGATQKDLDAAERLYHSTFNRYKFPVMGPDGQVGSPTIGMFNKSLAMKMHNRSTLRTMQNLGAWQNLRLLPLALLSSLVDPGGLVIRSGGRLTDSLTAMKDGIKGLVDKDTQAALFAAADAIGYSAELNAAMTLQDGFGAGARTPFARSVNSWVFKVNQMEAWTRQTRLMAVQAANSYLVFHQQQYRDPNSSAKDKAYSKAVFEKLGLLPDDVRVGFHGAGPLQGRPMVLVYSPEQAKNASKAQLEADARVKAAMVQWVDEAILRPNVAQTPTWHKDPFVKLITQYKAFSYSIYEQLTRHMVTELRDGNYAVLNAALIYLPVALMAELLREFLQHGPDGNPQRAQWTGTDYAGHAVVKTGLLGPTFDFQHGLFNDAERGGVIGRSFAGPTVGSALDVGAAVTGQKSVGNVVESQMPLSALWKHWNNDGGVGSKDPIASAVPTN